MKQIEIFEKVIYHWRKSNLYIVENRSIRGDSTFELEYIIFSQINTRLSQAIDDFTNEDSFCIFCMYSNYTGLRKAIHRYLMIEKETNDENKAMLMELMDDLNTICISINNTYKRKDDACRIVRNSAFDSMKESDKRWKQERDETFGIDSKGDI